MEQFAVDTISAGGALGVLFVRNGQIFFLKNGE